MSNDNEDLEVKETLEITDGVDEISEIKYTSDFTRFRNEMRKIFPRVQTLEEETADLIAAKEGDTIARDHLVAANAGSIINVVGYAIRNGALSFSEVLEAWDLLHAGVFGFYDAIRLYKNIDGTRLGPYATWRIKDSVLLEVGNSYVLTSKGTARVSRILNILTKRERKLALKLGREPRQNELFEGLSANEKDGFARMEIVLAAVIHVSAKLPPGVGKIESDEQDPDYDYEIPDEGKDINDNVFYARSFSRLHRLLENPMVLTGKQRQVLFMLYGGDEEIDFTKIGEQLGMKKEGAWRSHDRAIKKLRRYF